MEVIVLKALVLDVAGADIVDTRSVFLTPHDTFMPAGTSCPAIGLKDGKSTWKELAGGMINLVIQVECICWVDMTSDGEEALVGEEGVVTILNKLRKQLNVNGLGIIQVNHAKPIGTTPSRLFMNENRQWLVKKSVTFEYDVEFER